MPLMRWRMFRFLWLLLCAFTASPVLATGFPAGSTCLATARSTEDYRGFTKDPARWDCRFENWSIEAPRLILRFDLRKASETPDFLVTRLTRFHSMRISVLDTAGKVVSRKLAQTNWTPATTDWLMSTTLPRIGGTPAAIFVEIDGPHHLGMLTDARLVTGREAIPASPRHELLIAMLCGMLCMPLLFNLAFYRVLSERFLFWHALSTTFMLAHTLITSGLINRFATLSLDQLSIASTTMVGGGIITASFFAADLIETGKLDPLHRRALRCVAFWVPPWTLFYLFAEGPLLALAAPLYLASFLPLIALFVWVMAVAYARGSRAVYFQLAAWTPMMVTSLVRIISSLGATDAPLEMLIEQHYAMGLEVIITSLGVIDRLITIRRQRDLALAEMRIFEDRADRDPLTGLFNRRAIEQRFATLHAEGFHAMAVLDLDKFKSINDTHGHMKGDAVLCAAAAALAPDPDTIAVRLGGEEFLLLLRGRDIAVRAERRRQAIATRIAAEVPGLDRIVTASMGLVETPADGTLTTDFSRLYAHCDRLLYEAKDAGRNRTMQEKLQIFSGRRIAA